MEILIVEDDPFQRRVLGSRLRQAGYEVKALADGRDAWALMQTNPARLVITDWTMSEMSGTELIRRIRAAEWPNYTYTILVTARDGKADVLEGLASGADDYLTKPVDHRELQARIAIGVRMIELEDRLRASQERLRLLASHDGLTGLLNRQAIHEYADAELQRGRRRDIPVSIALLDVDKFKAVNDEHGHVKGDDALRAVAEALTTNTRPYDRVGRWGGEEFLLVLPDTTLKEGGLVAERIRAAIADVAIPLDDSGTLQIRVSIGVACMQPDAPAQFKELLRQADAALYEAKRGGRNCVRLAPATDSATAERQSA
ncbi:MAG: diguanylate cyclase [Dehalococcoidia bacterium]